MSYTFEKINTSHTKCFDLSFLSAGAYGPADGVGTERYPPSMFEKRQHSKDTWLQFYVATFVLNQILGYSKHFVAVAIECFLSLY